MNTKKLAEQLAKNRQTNIFASGNTNVAVLTNNS
jgi:hypothetical protein